MKNLKKVLSLGLALVMLLGMFTVASAAETKKSASDLTDWNTVQHKDAVSLMVDLGIIVGTDKGTFEPTGNIDRASWAKMVYFAATGSDDADAYLGTASGLGDIAGNWAESYISFLKASNYISGDNFGNYNPSANVTVAEACKMMLTVLGYDAEDRGYQNTTAWSGNIMTDARRNGLLENVDSNMTALAPLTRENAAEIVLNALNANTVISESRRDQGQSYVVKYTKSATLGYEVFDMVKVTAMVDGIDKNGMAEIGKIVEPADFATVKGNITGKVKAAAAVVGEQVNVYVKGEGFKWDEVSGELKTTGTFKSIISTNAAKAASTPAKVITSGGFTLADVENATSENYVAKLSTDVACYYNGMRKDKDDTTFTAAINKRGTVVEFYLDDNGDVAVIKAYEYTLAKVNGAVATKTLSDGTLQVTIPGVTASGYVNADKVTGWQDVEKDDVVLYYITTPKGATQSDYVYTIEKPEMITGKVDTFSKNGTLTVNGQNYRASGLKANWSPIAVSETVFKTWSYNLADEFNFWLDKNGSILAAEQVTESLDSSKVCLVIATEVTAGGLGTTGSLAANLLFVDGSTEIVNVSKVSTNGGDLLSVVDKKSTNPTTAAQQILSKEAQTAIAGKYTSADPDPLALTKFFGYRATSAGYELTELSSAVNGGREWEDVVTDTEASVMKESVFAKVKGTTTTALDGMITADLTTTFIIGKVNAADNSVTYSLAKGFRELHEMDTTKITAIAENVDSAKPGNVNSVAKYVYLETGAFKDDAPEGYVFIVDNNWKADPELYESDKVYQINIVDTDGAPATMRVDSSLLTALTGKEETNTLSSTPKYLRNFFQIGTIDENRVVSALGENGDGKAAKLEDVDALGNGVIALKSATGKVTAYDYDDATKFIYVDMAWEDDTENAANVIGQRQPEIDLWVRAGSGNFDPNGFFDKSVVDAGENDVNINNATYVKVQGTVICPLNSTTADYVYIVRYLW